MTKSYPFFLSLLSFLILSILVIMGFMAVQPPPVVPRSAPPSQFSAERAADALAVIASQYHPSGSEYHSVVRDILIEKLRALGLEPQVQNAVGTGASCVWAEKSIARVQNVVARIRGNGGGKALLLVAHYDTQPNSYGASDNGAAVAALLETARIIKNGPRLMNDVIILFTDAEEMGLLGADAFVREHAWARDVFLVLNFEARGHTGPVYLFETTNNNGGIIRELAKAMRYPVTSSLFYEIYKLLPNDTDFSVFKKAGRFQGFNFAFINGYTHYHTPMDTVASMSKKSLQHHGKYMTALVKHFGTIDLAGLQGDDRVYFCLPLVGIIHYPASLAPWFALFCAACFVAALVLCRRKKVLRVKGVVCGALSFLIIFIAAPLLSHLGWLLIKATHPQYRWLIFGDTYNSLYYLIAFSALTIAVAVVVRNTFARWAKASELSLFPLFSWTVLGILTSFLLPGASYLFVWPALFGCIGLVYGLWASKKPTVHTAITSFSAFFVLFVFPPIIWGIQEALAIVRVGVCMIILALALGLLGEHIDVITQKKRLVPFVILICIVIGSLIGGKITAGFSKAKKKPNSVIYLLNADKGQAAWISYDHEPDEWTQQFLGAAPQKRRLEQYRLSSSIQETMWLPIILHNEAPAANLAPPHAVVVSDSALDSCRRLRLRILSGRGAPMVRLFSELSSVSISDVMVDGHPLNGYVKSNKNETYGILIMQYFAPPAEGIELEMTIHSKEKVPFTLIDASYGLPRIEGFAANPRPSFMMPKPYWLSDITFVQSAVML